MVHTWAVMKPEEVKLSPRFCLGSLGSWVKGHLVSYDEITMEDIGKQSMGLL
jgi:hypothetical protein